MTISYYTDTNGAIMYEDSASGSSGVVGNPSADINYQAWLAAGNELGSAQISAITWPQYQAQAQELLDKSDVTIIRCAENQVEVPADWATYRKALRAIVGAKTPGDPTQPLPTTPAFPAGT